MEELISVIVPIYNMEKYLDQCISSILNQTYRKLEIVLVDDGSTDRSASICDRYAEIDNRIKVIHKENQGLVMARRTGLEFASAKYVGFVDSDDWIEPEMYSYMYGEIQKTDAEVVTTGRFVDGEESKIMPDTIRPGIYLPQEDAYFCKNMIMGPHKIIWGITPNFWNKLFVKEKIKYWQGLIDDEITYGEDDACIYPCIAFSKKVAVTDKCFYHYRIRNTSMSNSSDDLYMLRINKLFLALKKPFEKHPLSDILLQELSLYMMEFLVRGVNGLWGLHPKARVPRNIVNLKDIFDNRPILLYGAGKMGKDFYSELLALGLADSIVWVDKNYRNLQQEGMKIVGLDELNLKDFDKAIITIADEKIASEIRDELVARELPLKKIYWCRARGIIEVAAEEFEI